MQVTGMSLDKFGQIVAEVSGLRYDGNIIVDSSAHPLSDNRFRARLRVEDSKGPGARRSWSGRRMPAACWHAYRDVLSALFYANPDATVRTALATYKGLDGFMSQYPGTAYKNIGSMMQPAFMPELCECGG